ncbi:MAG: zf-HC2 domain-containing protein [bacterium]|nr:zf-HC2 domain-containing protein [bacterium]
MNSCPRELLPEYYRKSLAPEEMETINRHAAGCPECSKELQILASMDSSVPEPPASFWASLPARVTEEGRSRPAWTMARPVWAGGIAALILVAGLSLFLRTGTERSPNGDLGTYSSPAALSLGLEEEILFLSGSEVAFIDGFLDAGIVSSPERDTGDPLGSLFDRELLETMSPETIRVFEGLIDEMTLNQVERG